MNTLKMKSRIQEICNGLEIRLYQVTNLIFVERYYRNVSLTQQLPPATCRTAGDMSPSEGKRASTWRLWHRRA